MKKIFVIVILIILVNFTVNPIYANTEAEETDLSKEELDEILETASNLEKIPIINSRHAIIYDRISRKSYIWKKRK